MPPPFEKHVFICTNRRPDGSPKGCCASKGSEAVQLRFKKELEAAGIKGGVRPNKSGCLDACERGITVCVYPENVWYGKVTEGDVAEIVREHLVGGRVVERLRMEPYVKAPRQD